MNEEERRRKPSLTYKTDVTLAGAPGTFKWQVSADLSYGFPDHFDRKVFKILEAFILQQPHPIENPVHFSLYRILQMLGLPPFGVHFSRVRASIQRIAAVKIHAQFISASQDSSRHESQTFHIFNDVTFQEETFDNELGAGSHTLTLGGWYLDAMNRETTYPVDITTFQSLQNPLASRVYEFLLVKFPDVLENKLKGWSVAYSTLCQLLPVKEVSWASSPRRQFEDAHNELIANDLIDRVEWSKAEQGWQLLYIPGRHFFEEASHTDMPFVRSASNTGPDNSQIASPDDQQASVESTHSEPLNPGTIEEALEPVKFFFSRAVGVQEIMVPQPEENSSEMSTASEGIPKSVNSSADLQETEVSGGRAYADVAGTNDPVSLSAASANHETGTPPVSTPHEEIKSVEVDTAERSDAMAPLDAEISSGVSEPPEEIQPVELDTTERSDPRAPLDTEDSHQVTEPLETSQSEEIDARERSDVMAPVEAKNSHPATEPLEESQSEKINGAERLEETLPVDAENLPPATEPLKESQPKRLTQRNAQFRRLLNRSRRRLLRRARLAQPRLLLQRYQVGSWCQAYPT